MGYSHITDEDLENFGVKIEDARKIYNYMYVFLFIFASLNIFNLSKDVLFQPFLMRKIKVQLSPLKLKSCFF